MTSRSAVLSFRETFDLHLSTFELPRINYSLTCMDAYGSTVLAATLNDTQETKCVSMQNLRPFWEYTCRLVKVVYDEPSLGTTTTALPADLRFRTQEDGKCMCVHAHSHFYCIAFLGFVNHYSIAVSSYLLHVRA